MTVSDTPPRQDACVVCGCTDEHACPGGCSWVLATPPAPHPLCSTCELLTMAYDGEHWFPFLETEDADICGPGHQDKAAFAAAVNAFDVLSTGQDIGEPWEADDVSHRWAKWSDVDYGQFQLCAQTDEGAFPVTTIWGVR